MKIVACEGKKSKNSEGQGPQKPNTNANRSGPNFAGSGPQNDGDLASIDKD